MSALQFRRRSGAGTRAGALATGVVLLAALLSLFPFAFLLLRSLAPAGEVGPGGLWVLLIERMPVLRYALNSAVISLGATLLVLAASSLAGFAFAKLAFPFSRALYSVIVASIAVPLATTILPNYLNLAKLGGIGSYWGPILLYAALSTPFSVVLMTSFFRSLPDEVVDSAIVDGAGWWQVFHMILLRMAGPALVTVGALAFLATWNDLLVGLLLMPDPAMRTISVGVATLQGVRANAVDNGVILAGSLFSALPPILLFVVVQRYIVTGLTAGMVR